MSEETLILSIIGRAVEDVRVDMAKIKSKNARAVAGRNREDGLRWITSNSEKEKSFCWYCELLNLDPQWARKKYVELPAH